MFNTKTFNSAVFNNTTRHFASVYMTGQSTLEVCANYIAGASVTLQGIGGLVVSPTRRMFSSVSIIGQSNLFVNPVRIRYASSYMKGEGSLSITITRRKFASVIMEGKGILTAKGVGAGFIIGTDGMLSPLGVKVLRDSREELLPSTRESTETIPGKHGEIDFGSTFNARILELHVVTPEGVDKGHLKRKLAGYLYPREKTLIFLDDLEKIYNVKYSGKIDLNQYPSWLEFTIPFKMENPFIEGAFEQSHSGTGVLVNNGSASVFPVIEIRGPATNPVIEIDGRILSYTGTINAGKTVIVNTEYMAVDMDGTNVLENFNGVFPTLKVGNTSVIAGSNVTFRWRDRWV